MTKTFEVAQIVYRIDTYTVEADSAEQAIEIAKGGSIEPDTGEQVTDAGLDWLVVEEEI